MIRHSMNVLTGQKNKTKKITSERETTLIFLWSFELELLESFDKVLWGQLLN